ncbi:hypothetical protein SSTU70S_04906 [Stutzerimonas stutzeri]
MTTTWPLRARTIESDWRVVDSASGRFEDVVVATELNGLVLVLDPADGGPDMQGDLVVFVDLRRHVERVSRKRTASG